MPLAFLAGNDPAGRQGDGKSPKDAPVSSGDAVDAEKKITILDAVRSTLEKSLDIQLQKENERYNLGTWRMATGAFDPDINVTGFQKYQRAPLTYINTLQTGTRTQRANETSYSVGVQRKLRNGVTVNPNLQFDQNGDNVTTIPTQTRSTYNLAFTIPLMRNSGTDAVGAQERAAGVSYDASRLTTRYAATTSVYNTTTYYWTCLGALKYAQLYRDSEEAANRLVESTRVMIKADEMAAGELKQALATKSSYTASRLSAEQQFQDARQTLSEYMGLKVDEIAHAPMPTGDLPVPPAVSVIEKLRVEDLYPLALDSRADLQAAYLNEQAAKELVVAARNGLLPQMDLGLTAGYSGLDEGSTSRQYTSGLSKNLTGVNFLGKVTMDWPVGNNVARGALLQQESSWRQYVIQREKLARDVVSQVAMALKDIKYTAAQYYKYAEASRDYAQALANEREKYRYGMSTVLSVSQYEQQLASSLISQTQVQMNYANALANLRYQCGLLVSVNGDLNVITMEHLTSLPGMELVEQMTAGGSLPKAAK
ncbi:MAG: TolC family protein [Verrucomicrobiae bacterium]|nr:TolC family protein [Verrucomicrobiae bacterium]